MAIVRGPRPADNFAQIHNSALEDRRLSWKARGLLGFLLSRPPGWSTSIEHLTPQGTDGRDSIKSGLKELENHGYLQRTRARNADGTWIHNQIVTDQPEVLASEELATELPTMDGKSTSGESTSGKAADINNTDSNNTDVNNTDVVVAPSHQGEMNDQRTQRGRWQPTAQAMATARDRVRLVDIPIHITRYTVVCAEKRKTPSSPEWLRWILADEQQAVTAQKKEEAQGRKGRSWYDVAD